MRSRTLSAVLAAGILCLAASPVVAAAGVSAGVRASPITVWLALSPTTARIGEPIQAQVTITNLTSVTIKTVVIALRLDTSGLRAKPAASQSTQVRGGRSSSVKWSVCGLRAGAYVIAARATVDGVSIDSAARLLTITPGGKKACP